VDRAVLLASAVAVVGATTMVGAATVLQRPHADAAAPSAHATAQPRITLQPAVRATELPGITYTHVS